MARDPVPQTPSRRSKRFQPLATPSKERDSKLNAAWHGKPLHIRPTDPKLDFLPDEDDEDGHQNEDDEDEDEDVNDRLETVFYEAFEMTLSRPKAYRGVKRSKKDMDEARPYRIGDTITIETDTLSRVKRPPSVAVIIAMWETRSKGSSVSDPAKMRLRVHWFLRPSELANIRAKREHAQNEIYYSLASTETIVPDVIMSRCVVSGTPLKVKLKNIDATSPSKRRRTVKTIEEDEEVESLVDEKFFCHLAVNSTRGLFFELNWEKHHQTALTLRNQSEQTWGDGTEWDVVAAVKQPRASTSKANKRKKKVRLGDSDVDSESGGEIGDDYKGEEEEEEEEEEVGDELLAQDSDSDADGGGDTEVEHYNVLKTPSKNRKRKRDVPSSPTKATPRKRQKTLVHPTPHSKAAIQKGKGKRKGTAIHFPALRYGKQEDLSHLPKDAWLRAMHVLHVAARPDALPCREAEYDKILRNVGELLEEGSGGCVYISGVPGTGKTATVHTIIRELKRMAENNEINPFTYVEINGLKIPEPSAAYNYLWETISGHEVEKEGHLRISSKESLKALTRYFSGGGARGPGGHACVVLMDELDQLVTAKQDVIYNFFNWPTLVGSKLVVIAVANTMDLPERVMTGRVRSRLGMIRINFQPYTHHQLQEILQARLASAKQGLEGEEAQKEVMGVDVIKYAAMKVSGISGDARRVLDASRRVVELMQPKRRTARMTDIVEVLKVMQNSPTAAYLRECSFHERVMLTAFVKCIKRAGVDTVKWGDIQYQHLIYMDTLPSGDEPKRKPTITELGIILDSLVASNAVGIEPATKKAEADRLVMLRIETAEVERELSDVANTPAWKSVLAG